MVKILPAVLATEPQDYAEKIERATAFAPRLHIDIVDGKFAPNLTVGLDEIFLPAGIECDLHLMLADPAAELDILRRLAPSLVITHAEAPGDVTGFDAALSAAGIRVGLAVLPETTIADVEHRFDELDHLLVFTGHIGFYGGSLLAEPLVKIAQAKARKQEIEVSVDGGVSDENAAMVVEAGADVLISGGYIMKAPDPRARYETLCAIAAAPARIC